MLSRVLAYIRNQREHHARFKLFPKLELVGKDDPRSARARNDEGLFAYIEDDPIAIAVLSDDDLRIEEPVQETIHVPQREALVSGADVGALPPDDPGYPLQQSGKDLLALAEKYGAPEAN